MKLLNICFEDSGELNSEGELSEGELERKRKELLKQLNDS